MDASPTADTTTTTTLNSNSTSAPAGDAAAPATGTHANGSAAPHDEAGDFATLPPVAQDMIRQLRRESAGYRVERNELRSQLTAAQAASALATASAEQAAAQAAAALADAATYRALGDRIVTEIDAEIRTWPAEVIALKPAAASAPELIAWRDLHRPIAQRLTEPKPSAGQTPTPQPNGSASSAANRQLAEQAINKIRSTF